MKWSDGKTKTTEFGYRLYKRIKGKMSPGPVSLFSGWTITVSLGLLQHCSLTSGYLKWDSVITVSTRAGGISFSARCKVCSNIERLPIKLTYCLGKVPFPNDLMNGWRGFPSPPAKTIPQKTSSSLCPTLFWVPSAIGE